MKPPPTPSMPDRNPVANPIPRITQSETDSIPEAGRLTIGGILTVRSRTATVEEGVSAPSWIWPAARRIVRSDSLTMAWPRKTSRAA
jgi:hypothetical protein